MVGVAAFGLKGFWVVPVLPSRVILLRLSAWILALTGCALTSPLNWPTYLL